MQQTVDVIVSGCGPTGLLCAYMLVKDGHSVYLLDKKPCPTEQSRAFMITPRSLEILEHLGLAYRILQHGLCVRGAVLYLSGSLMGARNFEEVDTVFPQLTSLSQSKIESLLAEEIEKLPGGKVHWNTTLIDYEQREDYVIAQVKTDQQEDITLRAKYLIGADGCHSIVRKRDSTWTYDGHAMKVKFALADLELEGPDVATIRNKQTIYYHSKGACILIPLPHEGSDDMITMRLVANLGPYEMDDGPRVTHGMTDIREVLTMEKVKEIMDERLLGLKVNIHKSHWITYFHVNERIANGFRRNRAFLIGDAAHCHSPAGGQGMNIGFQDAENLAWKLSTVLKGHSSDPEKLLDSYTIEREPMVKSVMTTAGNVTKLVLADSYLMSAVRYLVMSAVFSIPAIQRTLITRLMQVDFCIGESPILSKPAANRHSLLLPGHYIKETRALVNRDVTSQVERKTIYQILQSQANKHVAFWVITRQSWQSEPEPELTSAFIDKITRYSGCKAIVFQSVSQYPGYNDDKQPRKKKSDNVDYWIDTHAITCTDSLTHRLGFAPYLSSSGSSVPPAALVVFRPDRYAAYSATIGTKDELDQAFTFLDSYLKHE